MVLVGPGIAGDCGERDCPVPAILDTVCAYAVLQDIANELRRINREGKRANHQA